MLEVIIFLTEEVIAKIIVEKLFLTTAKCDSYGIGTAINTNGVYLMCNFSKLF